MFFPFLDYKTVEFTHFDQTPLVAYTVEYRCMVIIELVQSNANDPQKGVSVYADNLGYIDDPTTPQLFTSGGGAPFGGFEDYGPVPYIFTRAGARILMNRADIYGQATIRIHIFKLPDA